MKKLTFLAASLLALFVGLGTMRALVVQVGEESVGADSPAFADGATFVIAHNIPRSAQEGTVTFDENYSYLWDNGNQIAVDTKAVDDVAETSYMWQLEAGDNDGGRQWFYIKNVGSLHYLAYTPLTNVDISDLSALSSDAETKNNWWNQENRRLNCHWATSLVDEKAAASQYAFVSISEGIALVGNVEVSDNQQALIDEVDDSRVMIVSRITMESGQQVYVALNRAYTGAAMRYCDYAAYWSLIPTQQVDDPRTELRRYLKDVHLEYVVDGTPGSVVEVELATAYNNRMAEIVAALDDELSADDYRAMLAEAQALVEQAAGFTYVPLADGYYRIVSSFPAFEEYQGVQMAMYAANEEPRWEQLDTDEAKFVWHIYSEDGHFCLRNVQTGLYVATDRSVSRSYFFMKDQPTPATIMCLGGNRDYRITMSGMIMHTESHEKGWGRGGRICQWTAGTLTGSAWYMQKLTDEEVAAFEADIDNMDANSQFRDLLASAKAEMEAGKRYLRYPLVTEVDQISSPASDPSEGSLSALIDGDNGTYWHSDWTGEMRGNENFEQHYLQFDLRRSVSAVTMRYSRRIAAQNSHPAEFGVWVSADGTTYTQLPSLAVEDDHDGAIHTWLVESPADFRYVRVRALELDKAVANLRCWHAAEMQFYNSKAVDRFAMTGEAGTALEEAIAAADGVSGATAADTDALQAALGNYRTALAAVSALAPGKYRIVSAYSAFEEQQNVRKAMYAGDEAGWRDYDADRLDQVWDVTNRDGRLYVKNLATQRYFDDVNIETRGTHVPMTATPHWVLFNDLSANGDFSLRVEGKGQTLHAAGHSDGAGSDGVVVPWLGWTDTPSAWNMELVSEAYVDEKWADAVAMAELIAQAKADLDEARNSGRAQYTKGTDKLLTDASQLSTNYQEASEGAIENAIDGDNSTYWHSDWHTTNTTPHYLQVELPAAYQDLVFYYVNRNGDNYGGSPISFRFDYCDTADGVYTEGPVVDGFEYATVAIEQEKLVRLPQAAKYIRIYAPARYAHFGKEYWHCAEIQFYEARDIIEGFDLFAKADNIGDGAATALDQAIAHAETLGAPTAADVETLRTAYNAFLAVYTDPATLKMLVSEAETLLASVEYGDEVGQKPTSAYEDLNAAIADTQAWLADDFATCTKAQLTGQEEALQAAIDAWLAVPVNDVATAVEAIAPAARTSAAYNLSGRRVTGAAKGLIIVNGKKVVVK